MGLFGKSNDLRGDEETLVPEVRWIPYREDGKVKYVRADDEEAEDFTVTGRSADHKKPSGYANMPSHTGGFVANAPPLLPVRYTDDSLIPAIVTNILPSYKPEATQKKSFLGLKKDKDSTTRTVWMPRGEYKKHFAKDKNGNYIGTEPQREWTNEELLEKYGQYHKEM